MNAIDKPQLKALEKLRAELALIGATLDTESKFFAICDAPKGYTWRANGCRLIVCNYTNCSQSWLIKELRDDTYPRLKMGLDKVTDEAGLKMHQHECDDDTWKAADGAPDRVEWPSKKKSK